MPDSRPLMRLAMPPWARLVVALAAGLMGQGAQAANAPAASTPEAAAIDMSTISATGTLGDTGTSQPPADPLAPAAALAGVPTGPRGAPLSIHTTAPNHYSGNFLVVAVGAVYMPSYDGSRHGRISPAAGILGRVGKISFSPRPAGLALDLIPDSPHRKVNFALGPVLRYASNRHGDVTDPVVARLGRLSPWWEGGIAASVSVNRVLTHYDALSLSTDVRWDISGHGVGRIISPSIGYHTPLSRAVFLAGSVFADVIDASYARYNYSITPEGSAASGLPAYNARGGLKDVGAQAGLAYDLDGNLLNGGFALIAGFNYTRLQGSAASTPITRLRGNPSEWIFGAGIGYSF